MASWAASFCVCHKISPPPPSHLRDKDEFVSFLLKYREGKEQKERLRCFSSYLILSPIHVSPLNPLCSENSFALPFGEGMEDYKRTNSRKLSHWSHILQIAEPCTQKGTEGGKHRLISQAGVWRR